MSISRKLSIVFIVPALALGGLISAVAPTPAAAQSIFASERAASAAGVSNGGGYGVAPGGYSNGGGSGARQSNAASSYVDGADPYAAIFAQIQTATSALLSGPGALAFGVLILGLGFGVAWRLVTKGVKSIAK